MPKPKLRQQVTTLWDYPSRNYGRDGGQGDSNYTGATPSYVIWNLLKRYTRDNSIVLDPMCGSGTTLDVCSDLNRMGIGYDISPYRKDILRADARNIPLKDKSIDFIFIDPPYGDNIRYSDNSACIGRLSASKEAYFTEMEKVISEIHRLLKFNRFMALYVCDSFNKKSGFVPIGYRLYNILLKYFNPIDHIAVIRHNKTLKLGNYRKAAEEGNFFLRGFNHLFIMKKAHDSN
jgi:DNA modification methylase